MGVKVNISFGHVFHEILKKQIEGSGEVASSSLLWAISKSFSAASTAFLALSCRAITDLEFGHWSSPVGAALEFIGAFGVLGYRRIGS